MQSVNRLQGLRNKGAKVYHMNKKQEANAFVRECITTALIQMLETQSFEEISVTEVVKKAGVCRVSFYRNFDSKEDVLRKHLKALLDEWARQYEGRTDYNLVQAIFEHYYKNRNLCILLYRRGLSHISLESVKEACGAKPEQPNVVAYTSAFIAFGLYGWIEEWFKRGMQESPEEMARLWEATQRK